MITIIDYGMGNLRSVEKALQKLGASVEVSGDPANVARAEKVVLPGVGAFGAAMHNLDAAGLREPILASIESGKPFLGICLGLQLLFYDSEEMGRHRGLGVFAGKVVRFPGVPGLRIPHMGWNQLDVVRPAPHLAGLAHQDMVYFVHSFFVAPDNEAIVATRTFHGVSFASSVWQENVFAVQFHPEKSSSVGARLLENFVKL